MKISIFISQFIPKNIGGTEIATYNIARYLAMRGNEVHIVTPLDKGLPENSIMDGINIHRIKTPDIQLIHGLFFIFRSYYLMKIINPDILHSQSASTAGITCLFIKKMLKKPFIIYFRGGDINDAGRFDLLVNKALLSSCDFALALTDDMKNKISIDKSKIAVIPNGIDISRFNGIKKEAARMSLGISADDKVLLYAGSLRPEKGVSFLIKSVSIIKRDFPDIKLLIVGDGKDRYEMEKLSKELQLDCNIRFVGRVKNEEVPQYFILSDIFILASLMEGFPNVLLEAMAAGLPIICTNVCGLPEIVSDGKNGYLIDPCDPAAIAEKVSIILNDEELKKTISYNNKKKSIEFSLEKTAEKLEEVYKGILKK